ncbi:MAG: hypothetical protein CMJ87_10695 [Planctomycetes bacterium]|nr:hypothetical protein [Planctomycetota bacterium]MDP6518877.1 hypothetical protein [Planctomycetota bacterium]
MSNFPFDQPRGHTPPLPGFVLRWVSLRRVRRELGRGELAAALGGLSRPELALMPRAERLRERVIEQLVRRARAASAQGQTASRREYLELLAREDPGRWEEVSGELGLGPEGEQESRRSAMRELLGKLRTERGPRESEDGAQCLHLAVDDAGEVLLAMGRELTVGHASAGQAELGFMADLESRHARLVFRESFHGGPTWRLFPMECKDGLTAVCVNGEELADGGRVLKAGDRVALGSNLSWTVAAPDQASSALMLLLAGGAECAGAGRIILLPPAEGGGCVSVGPGHLRHLTVGALDGEAQLSVEDGALCLSVRAGDGALTPLARLALPLEEGQRFRLGQRRGGGPPIDLWLRACEGSGPGSGGY